MPDIHIERNHTLGIAGARVAARQWIKQAEQEFGLECVYTKGEDRDVATFTRAGIDGTVEVTASTFTLDATLGFLFSSFSEMIEQKITRNLDALLESPRGGGTRLA
ncbi:MULTISPECIES: polyhydroxyalkanoic acid system family protein [Variovorax]|uniref:polyhydroxyalkanoic acid system family protein n=1 Tax=Variovorax TaxID=34072 RepID=UPI0008996984|nr:MULTISPECIES: polyhydroxyalkanoic acid system family protein [Variovorax]MDQ0083612.1 putative polyhydroxyalkanoate system protein [Variovorax boronicumulans]SDX29983.1 putative polyhydroxyalkanoic acid system protein [Variovorax sp. YR634]SDZ22734.1 putative polyhydroxyalkanoic acid system protein [Variovorax sp. YR266]SET53407.1 putative polyhydroxyalkanoic acid system protein [Variovorax sp. OV084]SOD30994.1 putative polyhydroxyalkanoic acid system protein [Variovorax sp. YR752]